MTNTPHARAIPVPLRAIPVRPGQVRSILAVVGIISVIVSLMVATFLVELSDPEVAVSVELGPHEVGDEVEINITVRNQWPTFRRVEVGGCGFRGFSVVNLSNGSTVHTPTCGANLAYRPMAPLSSFESDTSWTPVEEGCFQLTMSRSPRSVHLIPVGNSSCP